MVWDHVAQRARGFVVAAAQLDSQFLGNGDLHVIDVAAIPHRLENSVREAEGEKILNRFFAEVMIDAIGLRFLKDLTYGMIQSDRGSQVAPKGLFDNRAAPCMVIFLHETGRAEMLDDNREKLGADREIKEAVSFRPFVLLDLIEGTLEFGV